LTVRRVWDRHKALLAAVGQALAVAFVKALIDRLVGGGSRE